MYARRGKVHRRTQQDGISRENKVIKKTNQKIPIDLIGLMVYSGERLSDMKGWCLVHVWKDGGNSIDYRRFVKGGREDGKGGYWIVDRILATKPATPKNQPIWCSRERNGWYWKGQNEGRKNGENDTNTHIHVTSLNDLLARSKEIEFLFEAPCRKEEPEKRKEENKSK